MEGGVNPKKMARSKRASSQRSKAKHSKHGHGGGHVAAVTRERTVAEESLPSNWERYGDESGSDEDLAPLAEGEVRPKSKGADYRELLTSDEPQLFEESPEMEGMTAMLLANGLGLWDWDSSYLDPASLSSQRQAARESSALLTWDLRLLGKSLARLNITQRLFLEDELFPTQQHHLEGETETIDTSARISESEGAAAPMKEGLVHQHDDLSPGTRFGPGNAQVREESNSSALASETSSFNGYCLDSQGAADASHLGSAGTEPLSVNSGDFFTNSAPTVTNTWEYDTDMKEQMPLEKTKDPVEAKRFEATAAEAELDDLLTMLDNEVGSISLKKDNEMNPPRSSTSENSSFSSSLPASSRPCNLGFQESRIESRLKEVTPVPVLGPASELAGTSSESAKRENDPNSDVKAKDLLPTQDDDFDSWLDSI